ncbi:MAG: NUDIX domain-containing protein [Candidatus Rokuibacteriota bacterium]
MAHGPDLAPDRIRFCPLCGDSLVRRPVPQDGREQPVCRGCGFVFYLPPKIVAGTLPVRDGRVLLTRRAIEPSRGLWTFPGGYVDWGEDVREAARRETREEAGLTVDIEGLLGLYSYPGAPVAVVVYLASVPEGVEPVACAHEVLDLAYFEPEAIPWDQLAFPSTREALREWVLRYSGGGGGQPGSPRARPGGAP